MFCKDGAVLDVEAPRVETIDTTKTFRIPSQNLVKREYMFARVKDKLLVNARVTFFIKKENDRFKCMNTFFYKQEGSHVEGLLIDLKRDERSFYLSLLPRLKGSYYYMEEYIR